MPVNKRPKRKIAMKMRSNVEKQAGVNLFDSQAWRFRRAMRARKQMIAQGLIDPNKTAPKVEEFKTVAPRTSKGGWLRSILNFIKRIFGYGKASN